MSISTAENLRAGLTCCLLFVCIENLRGQYTESIRHLRAGSRVLASMLSENDSYSKSTQNVFPINSRSEWHFVHTDTHEGFHDGGMDDLAILFSSLGTACSIISDEEIVPLQHIAGCRVPNTLAAADSQVTPFSSLGEARQELHEITVFHDITWRQFCFPVDSTPTPPETRIRRKTAYCSIYQRFFHWSARFDAFMDHLLLQSAPAGEICDALKTRLDQKIWLALADEESWSADWNAEIKPSDLDAILADVELYNQLSPSPPQASFKFDMNLTPSLVFVGCFTGDVDLLRRVVVALKTLNRREGFWDTHEPAEIFEASITARSKYGWSIKGPQRGDILCFARSLASLNPPCIKATNSFLRFATEMV
ncbi:hypothetical protein E8E14_000950 [Neopestalotiopsis sp. 37M]|nr:hypothetical protein E8E14_000950 [Neopestalotiopsis sp. 37M]